MLGFVVVCVCVCVCVWGVGGGWDFNAVVGCDGHGQAVLAAFIKINSKSVEIVLTCSAGALKFDVSGVVCSGNSFRLVFFE